jgi:hypothetical protein
MTVKSRWLSMKGRAMGGWWFWRMVGREAELSVAGDNQDDTVGRGPTAGRQDCVNQGPTGASVG